MSTITGSFKSKARREGTNNFTSEEQYTLRIEWGTAAHNYFIQDPTEDGWQQYGPVLCFSPDPVHITCDRSDLTQLIMVTQAQIKLKVNSDWSNDLCASNNRSIPVTITGDTQGVVFFGYVDPLQFDQGYAHKYEEITLTATDPLGALEELTMYNLSGVESEMKFVDFIYKMCQAAFKTDNTKLAGIKTFFPENIDANSIIVNTDMFYGESIEDADSLYDVMNELLKYLGCTLCYEPKSKKIILYSLYNVADSSSEQQEWFNGKEDTLDGRASLSMDDVYNQVNITCEIEEADNEIKLVDSDEMYSDYGQMQKCMTELISGGEGRDQINGFKELLESEDGKEGSTGNQDAYRIDHFCYVKRNDAWKFPAGNYIERMGGSQYNDNGTGYDNMEGDQSTVLRWLQANPMKAAFVSFGKGSKLKMKDNSPVNNISLTDYLIISINGHNDQRKNGHCDTMYQQIQSNSPICTYSAAKAWNLVPTDKNVINYIVISGKMILNPLQPRTGRKWADDPHDDDWGSLPDTMRNIYNASLNTFSDTYQHRNDTISINIPAYFDKQVKSSETEGDALYQQKWWQLTSGYDELHPGYTRTDTPGIQPFLGNSKMEMLEYSWTEIGNENDVISKLPILACQLKIGDYYCVERFDESNQGGIFEWMTYNEWKTAGLQSKFDQPYFTIGIDPKVDEKIVGKQYSIQNNINYTMNIDTSGTAIPITIDDKLVGIPEFKILGPMIQEWNQIKRIHPSFWRHTKWENHKVWILEMLDSIMISDLKIEVKSNNGLYNEDKTQADCDLVYHSAMNPAYSEKLDLDLKICTPLTLEECTEMEVKYKISDSYIMTVDKEPFYGWTLSNSKVKPEVLLIDYLYKQYNKPAKILSCNVNGPWVIGYQVDPNTPDEYLGVSSILTKYVINMTYPGLSQGNFYCMSMDWSLRDKSCKCKFRQQLEYESPFAS